MNKKRFLVSIILIISIICISNIGKASYSYFNNLSGFKDFVFNNNMTGDSQHISSLRTYLSGSYDPERGANYGINLTKSGDYEIYINGLGKVGTLSASDLEAARKWVDEGCTDDRESTLDNGSAGNGSGNKEDSLEYQKQEIKANVDKMIGTLKKQAAVNGDLHNLDYDKYIKSLNEQLESVKNDNLYTGVAQSYRIGLYQSEIKSAEAESKAASEVRKQFNKESKGMTIDEVNEKIKSLERDKSKYQQMAHDYMENGQDRDTLLAKTELLLELYYDKKAGMTVDGSGDSSSPIYQYPTKKDGTAAGSLDDMIGDADKFLDSSAEPAIKSSALQNFSNKFYNIFLTIGIVIAVIVGMVLGIKFMVGGAEEKANIKEILVLYIVGCIVIFGAFAIWKLVVTILSSSFL